MLITARGAGARANMKEFTWPASRSSRRGQSWPGRSGWRRPPTGSPRAPGAPRGETFVVCGQGTAPAAATPEAFTSLGLDLVPGSGLLAATVPGAFGAWLLMLREYGTLPLRDVLSYAIGYAATGFPLVPAISW